MSINLGDEIDINGNSKEPVILRVVNKNSTYVYVIENGKVVDIKYGPNISITDTVNIPKNIIKPDNDKSAEDLFPQVKSVTYNPTTFEGDCRRWGDGPPNWTMYKYPDGSRYPPITKEESKKQERYTFFLDIDGCIFKHAGDKPEQFKDTMEVLPGVLEFCQLCGKQGHRIVLTSGRRKSFEEITKRQLANACVSYDELILGCSNNIRVLVNDTKPYREDSPQTAIAFNLVRDSGLGELVEFLKGKKNDN